MPPRFCSRCAAKALPGAKFCSECGASLTGTSRGSSWQLTATGAGALGGFLLAGLAIWAIILSPTPPRPAPGAGGGRGATSGVPTAQSAAEGQRRTPIELPEQAKSFIADLASKAKDRPQDVSAWVKLALVTSRAAQLDPKYAPDALAAFRHVLDLDPKHPDALRGIANLYYDREDPKQAIPFFERYLAVRPDDLSAWTDLGTMYLTADDTPRAIATYQDVIRRNASFLQARYNLALAYHRQGDDTAALKELQTARGLAAEDSARAQIDELIASLRDGTPPRAAGGPPAAAGPPAADRTPFQAAVEEAFRAHPIMGPRITRFDWSGSGTGRVFMQEFPMEAMPPAVREKFTTRLSELLRTAQAANQVPGPVRVEIADVATGKVMATVSP